MTLLSCRWLVISYKEKILAVQDMNFAFLNVVSLSDFIVYLFQDLDPGFNLTLAFREKMLLFLKFQYY